MADIGLVGLAVMGQNLVLNMNDHGFKVVVFNRTTSKVDDFLKNEAKHASGVSGSHSLQELVSKLNPGKPRIVMLLVKAGSAVDEFVQGLLQLLKPGDIIIDGGNSYYEDTVRRVDECQSKGILYVGAGVSGGEEGARSGPSLMPGGSPQAWPHIKGIFQAIAAKVDDGKSCCEWVGASGSGHFVKMVHNGIEYGDMQLICEAYQILRDGLGCTQEEMAAIFDDFNESALNSYLIEITRDILKYKEGNSDKFLLEQILDAAGQKGTGKWTINAGLDFGIPITLISEAVFARGLSYLKQERVAASSLLKGPLRKFVNVENKQKQVEEIREALYAAKIISYAQGFMLLREASIKNEWKLDFGSIALMWRGGCIIRSVFLGNIKDAFDSNPSLVNLMLDPFFTQALKDSEQGLRSVVAKCALAGIPIPAFSTALSFYDGYRCERLPANLIQAQRDYFGAHTYQLSTEWEKNIAAPVWHHTNWTGKGGSTSSSSYQV